MTAPPVTIGLPVYQGAAYLDAAIRSIRDQTFGDLAIVVADNGSTDATEEICRTHASEDDRITYHRSEVNRGSAWNYCRLVPLARGTYFKWASHDDVLRPTFVARCVERLEAEPDAVLAHTGVTTIDAAGDEHASWPDNPNAVAGRPAARFRDILFREGPCFPVFGVMRRDVVLRTGLLGPYNGHDRPFLAEMALHGRFSFVQDDLFLNREHPATSRAIAGPRERIAWFDPALAGTVVYYRPRLALEFLRAIDRSGVGGADAALAGAAVAGWLVREAPGVARDLVGGARAHVRALRQRGRTVPLS